MNDRKYYSLENEKLKEGVIAIKHSTCKINHFLQLIVNAFSDLKQIGNQLERSLPDYLVKDANLSYEKKGEWFLEGIPCQILIPGAEKWKSGKVRVRLTFTAEFSPDETDDMDSPLDDIRHGS
ncbi:MAG: KGK domain-containing protein [Cyanobacteriota bacterium]|nr:KGK domain-containing protein [Cyanobacteriota bacterium]